MKTDTWRELDEKFARHPDLRVGAALSEEIHAASRAVGLEFPADYHDFLLRYGAAIVGPYPIFGVRPLAEMGNEWSVTEMTRRFRADGWLGVDAWIVVSADHAGNPIGIDRDGRVWVSDHDLGGILLEAENFEGFLRKKCLRVR